MSVLRRTTDSSRISSDVRKVPTDMVLSTISSPRARQGPAQGDATVNSNYRRSDSAPIHPVARSILRTGTPEPRIKLLLLEMGIKHGIIKMKKIIVLVALICAL